MKGRIVEIQESTHQQVQMLLPWFDADTLASEEQALVQQHLQVCDQCQADLGWQRKMQSVTPEHNLGLDVERAFAKMRPQLVATSRRTQLHAIKAFFHLIKNSFQQRPWTLVLLTAQFSVIVGLAFVLSTTYGNLTVYRTLGAAINTGGNMVVVFKPETSEHELRRLLNAANAKIVDGPTLTDAYVISVPEKKLTSTINSFRSDSTVVLAESLSSGAPH